MVVCFVPGCTSGYKSNKTKVHIFKVPREYDQFKVWERLIPRADRKLSKNSRVCALHFTKDMIEDKFPVIIINGKEHFIERKNPMLKKNARPCIFPNLPHYLTNIKRLRKAPKVRLLSSKENNNLKSEILSRKTKDKEETDSDQNITFTKEKKYSQPLNDKTNYINNTEYTGSYSLEILNFSEIEIDSKKGNNLVNSFNIPELPKNLNDKVNLIINSDTVCNNAKSNIDQNNNGDENNNRPNNDENNSRSNNDENNNNYDENNNNYDVNMPMYHYIESNNSIEIVKCTGIKTTDIHSNFQEATLFNKNCSETLLSSTETLPMCSSCNILRNDMMAQKEFGNQLHKLKNKIRVKEIKLNNYYKKEQHNKFKFMEKLNTRQQMVIRHMIKASKSSFNRIIYEKQWLLECIIMKMKSPKLYRYLRQQKILPLPTINLLNRRLRNIRSGFGICPKKMELIKSKANSLERYMLHGNLLLDEMKLRESLTLSKSKKQIVGLVDLGEYSPPSQKAAVSDHGLIIMFQPYACDWKQVIAIYATKGNCNGDTLSKVVLNAIICSENAGLIVDGLTCDGASWNRKMFSCLGGSQKKNDSNDVTYKIKHPCDNKRFLFFFSDFPHLIKTFRNKFLKDKVFETHLGPVHVEVIKQAIKLDSAPLKLKAMPGIGQQHVAPDNFQKMKVNLAMQLFGGRVQSGIIAYQEQLIESYGSANVQCLLDFLQRIDVIINIMTSHFKGEALFVNSEKVNALEDFLVFIKEWEACSKLKSGGYLTNQTSDGIKMTIQSTISLLNYLHLEGFRYLITSRLSQDALENFFGLVRASTPTNDHPSPTEFLSIVEILSICSVLKPIPNSNVSPNDFTSLLCYEHSTEQLMDCSYTNAENQLSIPDHDYYPQASNSCISNYFSGYVARKFLTMSTCSTCSHLLTANSFDDEDNQLILEKDKYGVLVFPSKSLVALVTKIDTYFIKFLSKNEITRDSYSDIIQTFSFSGLEVGCSLHKVELSNKITAFVIMCRLAFHLRELNENKFNKSKFAKLGKLRKV